MKKISLFVIVLFSSTLLNGCDYLLNTRSFNVTVYNQDTDKEITCVYVRTANSNDLWSRNQITDHIPPNSDYTFSILEGDYEFKVISEDYTYSYEMYMNSVTINSDVRLNFCYSCYKDNNNFKVIKTLKKKNH